MVVLKNLLVASDFSPPSDVALDYGRELARLYGATLHVLHIVLNVMVQDNEVGLTSPLLQENLKTTRAGSSRPSSPRMIGKR